MFDLTKGRFCGVYKEVFLFFQGKTFGLVYAGGNVGLQTTQAVKANITCNRKHPACKGASFLPKTGCIPPNTPKSFLHHILSHGRILDDPISKPHNGSSVPII